MSRIEQLVGEAEGQTEVSSAGVAGLADQIEVAVPQGFIAGVLQSAGGPVEDSSGQISATPIPIPYTPEGEPAPIPVADLIGRVAVFAEQAWSSSRAGRKPYRNIQETANPGSHSGERQRARRSAERDSGVGGFRNRYLKSRTT